MQAFAILLITPLIFRHYQKFVLVRKNFQTLRIQSLYILKNFIHKTEGAER